MEIWHISQIAEVLVLSHTNVATSLTLAQSLNSNLGMRDLEGLTTVCNLISRHLSKNFIIQPASAANVTYCIIAVEFYKYFLQME